MKGLYTRWWSGAEAATTPLQVENRGSMRQALWQAVSSDIPQDLRGREQSGGVGPEHTTCSEKNPPDQNPRACGSPGSWVRQPGTPMANVLFSEQGHTDSGPGIGFWTFKGGWEGSLEEGDFRGHFRKCLKSRSSEVCWLFSVMPWYLFHCRAFCILDSKAYKKAYCRKSSPIIT